MQLIVRSACASDAQALCDIYNHFVSHTNITFEQDTVELDGMRRRIEEVTRTYPWLVLEEHNQQHGAPAVRAYAYATRWRSRAAYDHTAESTIYVDKDYAGRGLGRQLYPALLDRLREQGLHAVVGCIALPNAASVGLHEKCGFVKVGHFPEVGRKFGQWVDVGFWQAQL